ncbi:MAG TPA: hypothetical protein VJ992_11720 [Gemmatimonadales bacterium]|nr:hypothetical protein [Gemmatimonadales bacterium]
MFIELSEYLRCLNAHEDSYLVLATATLRGRDVLAGVLGCPVCRREYQIVLGDAVMGDPPAAPAPPDDPGVPAGDALQAMLDLASPGGYVMLVGSAASYVKPLGRVLQGVQFIAVNPPSGMRSSATVSVIRSPEIPLKDAMVRGVLVGRECGAPWLAEAARVVLPGRRVVALREDVDPPAGVTELVRGMGAWVGERGR